MLVKMENTVSKNIDIIKKDISSKINIYRTINDRTLSEEFHASSPSTQLNIKYMTSNATPTMSKHKSNIIQEETSKNDIITKYNLSNHFEREIMAQYGLVSYEFHMKNHTNTNTNK